MGQLGFVVSCPTNSRPKTGEIDLMLRYESSPGVRTEAWSRGPFGDATA